MSTFEHITADAEDAPGHAANSVPIGRFGHRAGLWTMLDSPAAYRHRSHPAKGPGHALYPGAVDLAFADTVAHGVIIKDFAESEQPGRYAPPEVVGTERRPITKGLDPYSICTSHVERNNLNIRTFMRRFTRLALGFSKKLDHLAAAVALYLAHYNYCRLHGSLRGTPAMRAGIAGHPWTLEELLANAGV
jgi:hypothetical protein